MWLNEAASSKTSDEESRHLDRAEEQLASALLASAAPPRELLRALELTREARREATD
jgi:hypothetical protein